MFNVNLIKVNDSRSDKAQSFLSENCTYIVNQLYVYEGDIGCLSDAGIKFALLDEGCVSGLGGMDQAELIQECKESFGVPDYMYDQYMPAMVRDIHDWFGLSYAAYLVLPRTLLQSMPSEWRHQMVELLKQMESHYSKWWPPVGLSYHVDMRDKDGKFVNDELRNYQRGRRTVTPDDLKKLSKSSRSTSPPKEGE